MLEEVSFLSAIGISLPISARTHGTARERLPIILKIAKRAVSQEQVVEIREGIGEADRDRAGDGLFAKIGRTKDQGLGRMQHKYACERSTSRSTSISFVSRDSGSLRLV
jgi:hypothetical protein